MTIQTNARVAGATFLIYIAVGMTTMATKASGAAEVVLTLVDCFCALVLAVTLYRITCSEDKDIAMLAMMFRVAEGVLGAAGLATRSSGNPMAAATFFAAGSLLFCWLLLRGRMIPSLLAWIGVFASAALVVFLPLQLGNMLSGPLVQLIWIPMALFEIPAGIWLLTRGVHVQ